MHWSNRGSFKQAWENDIFVIKDSPLSSPQLVFLDFANSRHLDDILNSTQIHWKQAFEAGEPESEYNCEIRQLWRIPDEDVLAAAFMIIMPEEVWEEWREIDRGAEGCAGAVLGGRDAGALRTLQQVVWSSGENRSPG